MTDQIIKLIQASLFDLVVCTLILLFDRHLSSLDLLFHSEVYISTKMQLFFLIKKGDFIYYGERDRGGDLESVRLKIGTQPTILIIMKLPRLL